MIIKLTDIPEEGRTYEGEEPASIIDIRDEGARDMEFDKPIEYEFLAQVVACELIVRGRLLVDCRFRCSRCGVLFDARVREPSFNLEVDVSEAGEYVDLTPNIREAIILAFPNYPVCSPACGGVCPRCGARLDDQACTCEAEVDPRWSALNSLGNKEK